MATKTRIYVVRITQDGAAATDRRLVRAASSVQAWRHVADSGIVAELASQDELIELAAAGVKVENIAEAPAVPG